MLAGHLRPDEDPDEEEDPHLPTGPAMETYEKNSEEK